MWQQLQEKLSCLKLTDTDAMPRAVSQVDAVK